jgi:hypothetical protein
VHLCEIHISEALGAVIWDLPDVVIDFAVSLYNLPTKMSEEPADEERDLLKQLA